MKAAMGALLIGLTGAAMSLAQSPAFNQLAPAFASIPAPLPSMPAFPEMQNRVGAQLPGMAVPMPPPPILADPNEKEWKSTSTKTPAFVDLNAPYNEPFETPPLDPSFLQGPMTTPRPGSAGPRFWMNTDYMMWWMKRAPLPAPLVVTGPSTDPFPGALDQPNTRVLYGGNGIGFNPFSGVRTSLGLWCGPENRYGFEIGGFILEQKSNQYRAAGDANGQPFLARPFVNAQTGFDNVYFVSQNFTDPDRSAHMSGGINVSTNSRFWSWEANGLYNFHRDETMSLSVLTGFRSVGLREKLQISESLRNLDPSGGVYYLGAPVDPSTRELTFDRFNTENTFYGGTLGTRTYFQFGRLGVGLNAKASIGVVQQMVIVDGLTAVDGFNGKLTAATPGGVYAVSSNMGRQFQQRFGIVPEGSIDFNFALTDNVCIRAGYTFVYLNSVLRPGNQINQNVNPSQVPSDATYGMGGGPASPKFPFQTSSVWLQGANLGVEFRY